MLLPTICYLYYVINYTTAEYMLDSKLGWIFRLPSDKGLLWDQLFNVYYISYMFLAIVLVYKWGRNSDSKREVKQTNIILTGFIGVLVLGSITDVFLPMVGFSRVPPISVILILGVIVAMCYAILKYSMMNITPESIMSDIYIQMNDGIIITDKRESIIGLNNGASTILGLDSQTLKGHHISSIDGFLNEKEEFTGAELELSGQFEDIQVLISKKYKYDQFNDVLGSIYTFQDISVIKKMQKELEVARKNLEIKVFERTRELSYSNERLQDEILVRKQKEEEINHLIYNDYLTNLPNRRYLNIRLKNLQNASKINHAQFAVLFLDLDNFKLINDTMGHETGDLLLQKVGQRLLKTLRTGDCICRVGGDEFVVLLENAKDHGSVKRVCEKILDMFDEKFLINSLSIYVKVSIGVSVYPTDSEDIDVILENADIAMYKVKASQKNNYAFYSQSMRVGLEEILDLTNDLYKGVEFDEFEVYYQPQIDSRDTSLTGLEALVRWNHPTKGLITPNKFIPLAESNGLIIALGNWIIHEVFKQVELWSDQFSAGFKVGINLSPNQLLQPKFAEDLTKALDRYKIDTSQVEFEVTEGIFVNKSEVVNNNLTRIHQLGFSIAIDDFGTEYASLNYLKYLQIDRIKIPRDFVKGISYHTEDEAIITSIITLSKKLNCHIIAEGVEHPNEIDFLRKNECHIIQGYYYYKPMRASLVEDTFFPNYVATDRTNKSDLVERIYK
jgi:diguanylate cyclase (GGDEF)-like protein